MGLSRPEALSCKPPGECRVIYRAGSLDPDESKVPDPVELNAEPSQLVVETT